MKSKLLNSLKLSLTLVMGFTLFSANAQTNVYDEVIVKSANHSSLEAAIKAAGLETVLRSADSTYTIFAPDNAAFTKLASDLNVTINDLLVLPNLSDILLYHVLGVTVSSSNVTNGAIVTPLNTKNTIKLTKDMNKVYANHAMVNAADLTADNGVVHSIDAVILSGETVVDIALDNGFSTLATAVIEARLLPALTNPFDTVTVFAPSNTAFTNIATGLGTDINGLLALPNLKDILIYHVLKGKVPSSAVTNGLVLNPLSTTNTIKLTKKKDNTVYVNQAKVDMVDLNADNGVVHTLNAVVLPNETVVDLAIDNGFSSLVAALVSAELVPTLMNPLDSFTVFAPSNAAFDTFASRNNLTIPQVLALPNLANVLTYHVVRGRVMSTDLSNGPVATLNTKNVIVDITSGVKINSSTVTTPNLKAFNGVVHAIDAVLEESFLSVAGLQTKPLNVYPNPTNNTVYIPLTGLKNIRVTDLSGRELIKVRSSDNSLDLSALSSGTFIINIQLDNQVFRSKVIKY